MLPNDIIVLYHEQTNLKPTSFIATCELSQVSRAKTWANWATECWNQRKKDEPNLFLNEEAFNSSVQLPSQLMTCTSVQRFSPIHPKWMNSAAGPWAALISGQNHYCYPAWLQCSPLMTAIYQAIPWWTRWDLNVSVSQCFQTSLITRYQCQLFWKAVWSGGNCLPHHQCRMTFKKERLHTIPR